MPSSASRAPTEPRGWTALVTGASSGIGEAFARALAPLGVDLVLAARSTDRLEALAAELRAAHPDRAVAVLRADLADPEGAAALVDAVAAAGLTVDLLVNNAGVGSHGPLLEQDPGAAVRQVRLNCEALVELTMRLLPGMTDRRTGGVIDVASTAGFQPVAGMAVYAATKAFVLSFSEAVWAEARGSGVRVLAVAPGPTRTRFFEAAGGDDFLTRGRGSPERVVEVALHAFLRGRGPTVVPGLRNRVLATGYRFAPRGLIARTSARITG